MVGNSSMSIGCVWLARASCAISAGVWLLGMPLLFASPFTSDFEYLLIGVLSALLGLMLPPVIWVFGSLSAKWLRTFVLILGASVCIGLIVTGLLLVLGASGRLGERAPAWLGSTAGLSLVALFPWVLLASLATRSSAILGPAVFRLGVFASACGLGFAAFFSGLFIPGFVFTDATLLFEVLPAILCWLCPPAWFVLLAIRIRPAALILRRF